MPRRQFVADLVKVQSSALPLGISDVKAGEDDGQIEFCYTPQIGLPVAGGAKITAMVPDLSDYPKSHEYMIFSDEDTPRDLASALVDVRGTSRKTVYELLDIVSATLQRAHKDENGDSQMSDMVEIADQDESEDDDDVYDSDHEAFADLAPTRNPELTASVAPGVSSTSTRAFRNRIRADLRTVKLAGFKVGFLGHLFEGHNGFVTISIRMSKLGISDEAMQAWQVVPSDYLMLIIQYPNGYKTDAELQKHVGVRLSATIGMRVVASKKYKPTLQEAIKAFTVVATERRDTEVLSDIPGPTGTGQDDCSIRDTFISKSLAALLNERLIQILCYRSAGMSWQGAENWYNIQINRGLGDSEDSSSVPPATYFEPEAVPESFPYIVRADHYNLQGIFDFSFPLVAMQFLLRHFVRCTEFCLVCHRRLDTEVEAIKPYVCDQGLCLYQYMTLGFGPSIEHEILAQPYVVDLLVSFAYSSAAARKLIDLPDALSLIVPYIERSKQQGMGAYVGLASGSPEEPQVPPRAVRTYKVGFDQSKLEMIFWAPSGACPVRKGQWIVLSTSEFGASDPELHCRITETAYYPVLSIGEPIVISNDPKGFESLSGGKFGRRTAEPIKPAMPKQNSPNWADAWFRIYDHDFEQLQRPDKHVAICKLLDTLPSVIEMRGYLILRRPAELKSWIDRISPSALSLLRWIIASNRACIMQVDGNESRSRDPPASTSGQSIVSIPPNSRERVFGMKNYMQFRFAMGAPDKEQRFLTEVRKTSNRLRLQYPTIFAWHGSPLFNWHMIIREGLHYKNKDHGRAYGDGIYHAKESNISIGYAGHGYGSRGSQWQNSVLRVSSALALNEIVNAPAEFQSQNPYYVVQHLDWIQTRFLFVQCAPTQENFRLDVEAAPANAHPQDPKAIPMGVSGQIIIPASTIHSGSVETDKHGHKSFVKNPGPLKKLKAAGGVSTPISIDCDSDEFDDNESVDTDPEDLEILYDEPADSQVSTIVPVSTSSDIEHDTGRLAGTDFRPGTLDFNTLPIMPVPKYATSGTTKCLMKELQTLQKLQERTPLVELGWYIDIEKIENVYQWIVELHSFHTFEVKGERLPLADDMKSQGIESIVLEVRFHKDFPYTPPYVRVIRPRFLTLAQGGGGHVVMGGAMCMELLTNTGWSSVSSIESVLMQIRLAIASEPFARLDKRARADYGASEGAQGYIRAAQGHGWQIPPGFSYMAFGKDG